MPGSQNYMTEVNPRPLPQGASGVGGEGRWDLGAHRFPRFLGVVSGTLRGQEYEEGSVRGAG